MTFDSVRVISKGNKYSIEFIISSTLLLRLLYMKRGIAKKSVVNDGKIAITPKDEKEFMEFLGALSTNKETNSYLIEKYFARQLNQSFNDRNTIQVLSPEQLIRIAMKKYKLPEYQVNRFTSLCDSMLNQ